MEGLGAGQKEERGKMSLIDVFGILFQSNAKEVKKDTQEAGKAVDELENRISDSNKATNQLGDSFKKMITAGVSALGTFATFNALKNSVLQTAATNAELERQSRLTGESAANLAAWDAAVEQAGGKAGEFTTWLAATNDQFVKMGMGNRTGAILQNLKQLSASWREAGLSMADMLAQGNKAGISDNIVLLMAQGPEKIQELIDKSKELQGINEDNQKASRDFVNELNKIGKTGEGSLTALIEPAQLVLKVFRSLVDVLASAANGFMMIYHAFEPDKFASDVKRQQAVNKDFLGNLKSIFGVGNEQHSSELSPSGSNAEESRRFWLSKGFTPAQVAGIMANEQKESGYRADAVGDNGAARGAFQWHADRRSLILAATGIDINNATHAQQLEAAWWEMRQRGDDRRVMAASTADEAGAIFSRWFERPANSAAEEASRGLLASKIYSGMMQDMMASAKNDLKTADSSPLGVQAMGGNTVNVGNITIHTQAQDARTIAAELKQELNSQYRNAIGNWDDGRRN